ncbi:hypothetical protein DACRYDRAFT_23581 [Dacryopinax primogenitus]|uniref:Myb-like domain-containing protein n=1 Tax=Dacryopinax primogenitus (strain DJM 731) TaxID=1858805 RepID=M5FS02_DACPD|nr:uncharacterized protein DACRYDRAFT_23581 [Dacryopinax primogenitus]EJU00061.1 hypothetical protein DACRYDRAFT_23581 [Dacryopinax primogenitus]
MLAADPGAPLDVNTTLMSDILRDPGVGKLSNRFVEAYRAKRKLNEERRKERERRREEMVRRKRELEEAVERGEGRALGAKAAEDDGEGEQHAGEGPQDAVAVRAAVVNALRAAEEPTPPPEDGPFRETHTAPQLRMGAHGEWEIDEDLLLIDRAADPALQQEEELEEVEERESDRFVTSFTWSKLEKNPGARARWSREETELLCKGIGWFGYDFEMISKLFVGRDRLSVKRRWKNVEKVDPARAQAAWENREPIDLSYFSKHIGTNLLLPAAPIQPPMLALPPSTPPPDETPVLRLPAPKAARGEPEEEIFDMDVGEETYEEIDLDEEELPTLSEAMMV